MADQAEDPFAVLAREQISAPVRARMRAAKTRAERKVAKAQDDKQIQHELWRSWHRQRVMALKKGRYAKEVSRVADFLEQMTIEDGGKLIALIEREPWLKADVETKYLLLGLISRRIVALRVNEGLAPFEDSIPFSDELPTVFEIIRKILG